jgi:hypothetical protein
VPVTAPVEQLPFARPSDRISGSANPGQPPRSANVTVHAGLLRAMDNQGFGELVVGWAPLLVPPVCSGSSVATV